MWFSKIKTIIHIHDLFIIVCFIQGNISLEKAARKRPYGWIPEAGWEDVIRLSQVCPEAFSSVVEDIEKSEHAWKNVRMASLIYIWFGIFIY